MEKRFFTIFFLAVIMAFCPDFVISADKAKLALIPFKINSAEDLEYLRDGTLDMLSSRIALKGDVLVLEKTRVSKVLETPNLEITESTAQELGVKLEVDFVVFGSITKIGKHLSIDAKMIDIKEKKLVGTVFTHAEGLDGVIPKIMLFASDMHKKIVGEPLPMPYTSASPPHLASYPHPPFP
jgi:TolB-like protein